jgi:hypothetical protein
VVFNRRPTHGRRRVTDDDVIELDSRLQQLADELNHALIEQLATAGELTTPA